jgi:dihydrofolate reductase
MTRIILDITMSLDGYVAGPDPSLDDPLGKNGMLLHEWLFGLASFTATHGLEGGEHDADDERVARSLAAVGAQVMGRRMFSGGSGPWEADPNAGGWWGDEPPFRVPVFVVTHHTREPVEFPNGTSFIFVTGGAEAAVEQARTAAGGKDVRVAGGASVATQCLDAGLLDRLDLHVAPILLGAGTRLFDGADLTRLEIADAVASEKVAHLSYRPAAEGSADQEREGDDGGAG